MSFKVKKIKFTGYINADNRIQIPTKLLRHSDIDTTNEVIVVIQEKLNN